MTSVPKVLIFSAIFAMMVAHATIALSPAEAPSPSYYQSLVVKGLQIEFPTWPKSEVDALASMVAEAGVSCAAKIASVAGWKAETDQAYIAACGGCNRDTQKCIDAADAKYAAKVDEKCKPVIRRSVETLLKFGGPDVNIKGSETDCKGVVATTASTVRNSIAKGVVLFGVLAPLLV